jgi:transcriptional regulator with XRE-family HTH domain
MKELPDRWRELGEFIREQRAGARLSLRRLSDMAGISNPYLSQIERGLRKPSAEILQQIAKALRISAETLYVRAGILEERLSVVDLVDEILHDPSLTEDQRRTLVQVYLSFRHENGGGAVGARPDGEPLDRGGGAGADEGFPRPPAGAGAEASPATRPDGLPRTSSADAAGPAPAGDPDAAVGGAFGAATATVARRKGAANPKALPARPPARPPTPTG